MLVRIDGLQLEIIKSQLVESHTSMNGLKPELSSQAVAMQRVNSFAQLFTLLKRLMGFTDEINKPVNAVGIICQTIDTIQNIGMTADTLAAEIFKNGGLPANVTSDVYGGGFIQNGNMFGYDGPFHTLTNLFGILARDLFYELVPSICWTDEDLANDENLFNNIAESLGLGGQMRGEALWDGLAGYTGEQFISTLLKNMDDAYRGIACYTKNGSFWDKLYSSLKNPNTKLHSFWTKNGKKLMGSLDEIAEGAPKILSNFPRLQKLYNKLPKGGASANGWASGMGAAVIIDSLIDNYNIDKEYADKLASGDLTATQASAGALGEKVGSITINSLEGIYGTMGGALFGLGGGIVFSVAAAIELDLITAAFSSATGDPSMQYTSFADLVGDTFIAYDNNQRIAEQDAQFVADMELLNAQREAYGLEPIDYDPTPTKTPTFGECLWDTITFWD